MSRKLVVSISLTAFLAAASLHAGVVANYSFTSGRASTDSDPNSTASTFDGGPGFQSGSVDNSFIDTAHGNPAPSIAIDSTFTDGTSGSQASALTNNDYFTFTISPMSGFPINFSSLSFDFANYSSTSTFPTENFFVRSSADNFGANLASAVTATAISAGAFSSTTIDLSSKAALQNVTTPIEFRIYVYDSTNTAGRGALLDNITVNSVPEPSTWAMMIAGAGLLGATQRLRRKR